MPELIACPSCQNKISERATTCPKCGSERQKQCMVCKKFIMIDSISCPECGDPNPFDEQLVSNKETKKYETKITAITIPNQDNEEGYEQYIKTTKTVSSKKDSGSKQWSIYTKGGRIEAVKHGFCWPAFFFTFGWAIFKSLWLVAISYFVFLNFMEFTIYDTLVLMDFEFAAFQVEPFQIDAFYISLITLELIFRFAFGYSGNKLVASRLEKKGFWKGITLNAKNKQSAIEQYKQ
jgi:RNA polymerase subunit RPABC4/transcription elongation factor Spt4